MSGPIGLHGGGEYLSGDEPFLDALVGAAVRAAVRRRSSLDVAGHVLGQSEAIRVVVVPTAAARGRPDLAAANGVAAFERRVAAAGVPAIVEVARVVDATSAMNAALAATLRSADLIHFPGGDPDLIPRLLARSAAVDAIREAWNEGSVVAGASAGAM